MSNIKAKINSPKIDFLFTQFSYANWAGNKEDKETRKKIAASKLRQMERQVSILRPTYTIPFASFVWFCHEENFYMNDEINKIDDVYTYLLQTHKTIPLVLFPNEQWDVNSAHNSMDSVNRWINSYRCNIVPEKVIRASLVEPKELLAFGNNFIKSLLKNNTKWMYLFLKPSHIYIDDHHCSYTLSLKGFEKSQQNKDDCDVSMSSDSIAYCFRFLWGGSTTRINGRYQVPLHGKFYNWKLYFQTSKLNNHGEKFNLRFILKSLARNIRRKIYGH